MRASLIYFACSALVLCSSCTDETTPPGSTGEPPVDPTCEREVLDLDTAPAPPVYTPRWAFEPWISKDISDGPDTYAFVEGFRERDIPIGVVVLDSPWETNYNTFVPNPERYPEFETMVADLRAIDIRLVLWVTQMINKTSFDLEDGGDFYDGPSPNYEEAQRCGYFVNDGETYGWWKGLGAGIDFFNPKAMAFWHRQQDALFDMGVAGWKLDFGESYISTDVVKTFAGDVSHQEYSEKYYEDFFAYGAARRGADEFVTMVRPYDASYEFEGRFFARPEHTPIGWVGDNRRDWVGLADALDHIFRSAEAGYVAIGSDIGGYLDRDDMDLTIEIPPDADVFARWTALGALNPFMQLHGRANITPWTIPGEGEAMVPIYRYWSKLHHELVPFFYSVSAHAYGGAAPPIRPIGDAASWPGDYRYHLGDAFLVAPVLDASGSRPVALPAGATYYDWWAPASPAIAGGQTLTVDTTARERIPLYVKEGAIIPAVVTDDVTGLGNAASAGLLTILVYPGVTKTSFAIVEDDASETLVEAVRAGGSITVDLSRALSSVLLRVRTEAAPGSATAAGRALVAHATRAALDAASSGTFHDAANLWTWVKLPPSAGPVAVVLGP